MAYPRKEGRFKLYTDAALGDPNRKGGMGAALTQLDIDGKERVIAYASRGLKEHEANYSAYLLEMAAASWGIEHFSVYLVGKRFTLCTDHKPLETLSTTHTKTLNRLQQLMLEYEFDIEYKKGEDNTVADFLSRNVVELEWLDAEHAISAVHADLEEFRLAQDEDLQAKTIKEFLKLENSVKLTQNKQTQQLAEGCFENEDGILMKEIEVNARKRTVVWPPPKLRNAIMETAHITIEAGHGGNDRTVNRIKLAYWWPGITADVARFVQSCAVCQRAKAPLPNPAPLQSMPVPIGPNHRVHIDLMGPLRTSENGNKYVMVMTDAFTKWVELAAITDKTAKTIGRIFFEGWICRFSAPLTIVTDQGKEFNNAILKEICQLWQIDKKRTSPFHPQTNSSAESYNRSLIKYFKAMLADHSMLDWECLLPCASMAYNCHIHRSTAETPFFLTYLHDPRLPYLDLQKPRQFKDDSFVHESYMIAQKAFEAAGQRMQTAAEVQKEYYDRRAKDRVFQENERVLVYFPNPPVGANRKFHIYWKPGKVIRLVGNLNVLVGLEGVKNPTLVHMNRVRSEKRLENEQESEKELETTQMKGMQQKNPQTENDSDDSEELTRQFIAQELDKARQLRAQGQQEDEEEEEEMGQSDRSRRLKEQQVQEPEDSDSEDEEPEESFLGPWLQLAQGVFQRPATRSRGPVPEQPLVQQRCYGWRPYTRKPQPD